MFKIFFQVIPVGPRLTGEPLIKSNKTLKCPRHQTLGLDRYCLTCTRPTCKDCAVMYHMNHEIFDLNLVR